MNRLMRFGAYLACVNEWSQHGLDLPGRLDPWISSAVLAEYSGVQSSQVRRDLGSLDTIGRRGSGYRPAALVALLVRELEPKADELLERARQEALLAAEIHHVALRLKEGVL